MATSHFVSIREAAQLLGISEKKVMTLISERKLQAYRIADKFLRLKKNEVMDLRNAGDVQSENIEFPYTSGEKLADFLYFNDFYLIALGVIAGLLFYIFKVG